MSVAPARGRIVERIATESRIRTLLWQPPLPLWFTLLRLWCISWSLALFLWWTVLGGCVLLMGSPGPNRMGATLAFVVYPLGVALTAWWLYCMAQRIGPESVTLNADSLTFDPGNLPAVLLRMGYPVVFPKSNRFSGVFNFEERTTISKADVTLAFERDTLDIHVGQRRYEIAHGLTLAEKAWLFETLTTWRATPAALPATGALHAIP